MRTGLHNKEEEFPYAFPGARRATGVELGRAAARSAEGDADGGRCVVGGDVRVDAL